MNGPSMEYFDIVLLYEIHSADCVIKQFLGRPLPSNMDSLLRKALLA